MKVLLAIVIFFALFGPSLRENSSVGWRDPNGWDAENVGFRKALIAPRSHATRLGVANEADEMRHRLKMPGQHRANDLAPAIWDRADDLNDMAVPDSHIDYDARINAIMAQIAVYKDSLQLLTSDSENRQIEIGIMKGRIAGLEIWLAGEKAKAAWAQSPESYRMLPALPLQ